MIKVKEEIRWRHRATCSPCGLRSRWHRDRQVSQQEIWAHLKDSHNRKKPRHPDDYRLKRERQCDFCLEPYVDDCTKCGQDFCRLHASDIDGLCGGCIGEPMIFSRRGPYAAKAL